MSEADFDSVMAIAGERPDITINRYLKVALVSNY